MNAWKCSKRQRLGGQEGHEEDDVIQKSVVSNGELEITIKMFVISGVFTIGRIGRWPPL